MDQKREAEMNRYLQYMYSYPHKTAYRPLQNVNLKDYLFNLEGEGHSLYLHLPFCESKCGYCNLFSVTGCNGGRMEDYLDAVLRQIRQYKDMMPRSTSFGDFTVGGGTPLLLAGKQIERVFDAVARNLPMSPGYKIVIETAPNQTTGEKAELLKKLGVTRVSMGIQSFDDGELRWLGRSHDSERARAAAGLLADMGFECVNFDFIYGLPGQTEDSLIHSLETALSFFPDEIFLYPLYIKHGVRLEREGREKLLDSDHAYALYQCGAEYLRENGYIQMSMRRFMRKNSGNLLPEFSECGLKSALSIGCGGRSYLGRLHTCAPYRTTRAAALEEIERYQHTEDFSSVTNGILLSEEELRRRYVIKHLLILPGISGQAYQRAFRSELLQDFPVLRDWIERGWLEEKHANINSADAVANSADAVANSADAVANSADAVINSEHAGTDSGGAGIGSGGTGISREDAGNCSADACDTGAAADDYVGLTEEGLGLSDYIGPQLISEEIRDKMLEWERING